MDELTSQGMAALKAGDKARARFYLRSALEQDLNNIQAWIWLSGAVETDDERLNCLREVMRIDPGNPAAARGISRLTGKDVAEVLAESAAAVVAATFSPGPAAALSTSPVDDQPVAPAPVAVVPAPAIVLEQAVSDKVEQGRSIFKTRPSFLPVLLLMVFGTLALFGLLFLALYFSIEPNYLPLIFPALIVVLFVICVWRLAAILATRYTVTGGSVEIARGLFRRSRQTVARQDIIAVICRRSLLQHLLGIGSIIIKVANGDPHKPVQLVNVPRSDLRTRQIQQQFGVEGQ